MEPGPDAIVIRPSRGKAAGFFVLFAALAWGAHWLVRTERAAGWLGLLAWATFLLLGFLAATMLFGLVVHPRVYAFDEEGVWHFPRIGRQVFLAWKDVARIRISSEHGTRTLKIQPREMETLLAQQSRAEQWATRRGVEKHGISPLTFSGAILPMSVDELADRLESRFGVTVEREEA